MYNAAGISRRVNERLIKVGLLSFLFSFLLMTISCVRQPRIDDAGDYSFARQIIPKLYGRKAKGYSEIKLVGDLSAQFGREATIRALMAQPEFTAHWSEVLVDRMRINRDGPKRQNSCFPETYLPSANSGDLASWVRDHYASANSTATCAGGSCGNFTMSDVLKSSLHLDDLSPAYRSYLFPLINKTNPSVIPEAARADLFTNFETVYLGRRNTCLTCHNSAWSTSGPQSYWNRTHPLLGLPELAVYGANTGRLARELESMMRTDAAAGAHRPWGLSSSCGSFQTTLGDDSILNPGEQAFLAGAHGKRGSVFNIDRQLRDGITKISTDGIQRFTSAQTLASCSVCGSCTGTIEPTPTPAEVNRETAAGAILGASRCTSCHSAGSGGLVMTTADWKSGLIRVASTSAANPRVKPGDAAASYLMTKLRPCVGAGCPSNANLIADMSHRMPYGGPFLNNTEIATIEAWINGMPTESGCGSCSANQTQGMCDGVKRELDPDEALALLVGANTVNTVWTEMMGYPLTIDNGFPRNEDQKGVLWNLTEYNFLNKHWSLRELLVRIVNFRFYNRTPPSASSGTTGYEIAMLFDPWVEGDPRVPPQAVDGWTPGGPAPTPDSTYVAADHPERHNNAMTETVHRYSANTLLNSVSNALAWPKPKRFPDNQYPSAALASSIGQFIKDAEPGFLGIDMQGLLNWEASVGQCNNPVSGTTDWIDRLLAARIAYDGSHPANPITVNDFTQTMRDWLINDGNLRTTAATGTSFAEEQLIANFFGVATLNTSASAVVDLPTKARKYCGVLLKSPQFMLAGITPSGLGNKPKLQVCNAGDDCAYQAMCVSLLPALSASTGEAILCGTDSVRQLNLPVIPEWVEIFPKKWLWGMEKACLGFACQPLDRPDFGNLMSLSQRITPQVPGSATLSSLPVDFQHILRNGGVLAMGVVGERVNTSEGVTLQREGKEQTLAKGETLNQGDLLIFAAKGFVQLGEQRLEAPTKAFEPLSARISNSNRVKKSPLIVYAVEKERLQIPASATYAIKPPMPLIQQLQESEWMKYGSGGRLPKVVDPKARQDSPDRQSYWLKQHQQLLQDKPLQDNKGRKVGKPKTQGKDTE